MILFYVMSLICPTNQNYFFLPNSENMAVYICPIHNAIFHIFSLKTSISPSYVMIAIEKDLEYENITS